ncbi:hypothetical protein HU200_041763 [Digitaria exilis]|uniref:Uncharacterized protein n=1 Tax=Digitaria exilis TaxID=1010633 RepID=A0A835B710_9POAL|nr:hypothetical protein HU200_041763 [Digitaria exilis]
MDVTLSIWPIREVPRSPRMPSMCFDVAAKSIPTDAVNVATEEGNCNSVKVEDNTDTWEEMHIKVVVHLKMLLGHIDHLPRVLMNVHVNVLLELCQN